MALQIDGRALYQRCIFGALGGLLGWGLLCMVAPSSSSDLANAAFSGALVGLTIGACCGAWDGLFRNRAPRRAAIGAGLGAALGALGGLIGLGIGQQLYAAAGGGFFSRALGWAIFGAAVGATEGLLRRSPTKIAYGCYGGFLGGLVGGSTYQWLVEKAGYWFARDNAHAIGSAVGLMLLGMFVSGFIGLVEDLLRAAWLIFTSGRLEGQSRTLDPRRPARIGRSDAADICILGDPNLAQQHAQIVCAGGDYFVEAVDGAVQYGKGPRLAAVTRQQLQPGDIIAFGSARATFHLGSAQS
jgi:MFS family permease